MPVDFLTTEQTESYGRFTGEPDELQLARYFHLDEADKEFIGKSRGDHNRLGIALQIGCVRFLGTFLTDMNHIPSGVRHFTARQLGIRDITVLAEYGQRENTRREHAALIRQHYQYREFAWPLKWFTEFGHLNRGDMLTSEQHRCHNEKKKFQRRV